jgi:hypothetical protein
MCASVWVANPQRAMKVNEWDCSLGRMHHEPILPSLTNRFESEHICWDPKDGELCLNRVKSEETLMEARSDSDVQIDRQIWV